MKKLIKRIILLSLLVTFAIPNTYNTKADNNDVKTIELNSIQNSDGTYTFEAKIDGVKINEYDYTWNVDPKGEYKEVKNSPAEYYTGTKPNDDETIYIAHDIYYYPELDTSKFKKVNYDGEQEWVYYYESEKYADYIFSTLPVFNNSIPTEMMHTAQEAYQNAVLHISQAGTYKLTGNWHGQVYIDLGEDAFTDETAVVTLILDNVDIECSVASAICFYQCYEVDNTWEDRETAEINVDTIKAGANVIIADGSENNISGTNIFRILKTKYKDENSTDEIKVQKKRLKVDAAFYSYVSMNVDGETKDSGILNIESTFEGLDSELHLTINGGNINITSGDDGINVNEDGVSVLTINDGTLQIVAGNSYEGDGVDSNGYIVINGGTTLASAKPQSDSGLDSDCGTYINGGYVLAVGSSMDVVTEYSEDANQVTCNLIFSSAQQLNDTIAIADAKGNYIFVYDGSKNSFMSSFNRTYQCIIISTPDLKVGSEYNIYTSGNITGNQTNGLYTSISKVTNAKQLAYTSTGNNRFNPGGNFNPFNDQDQKGQQPGNIPNGQENMPSGQGNIPEGQGNMPTGQGQGNMPSGDQFNNNQQAGSTTFLMEDKVNTFSGITYASNVETKNNLPIVIYILAGIGIFALGAGCGVIATLFIKKKKIEKELING